MNNSVIDKLERKFQIRDYNRIVSLVPSITETLFEFGLESRVVGVTKFCVIPPEAQSKEIIGGTKSINIDKIIELKPDLIIGNMEENHKSTIEKLESLIGFEVYITFPKSINDAISMMNNLAKLLNLENNISIQNIILNLSDTYLSIKDKVKLINRKKHVFCPIWKNPWMSINRDTFIHSILDTVGLVNLFADEEERYPTIKNTTLYQSTPDIILLPNEPFKFSKIDELELKNKFRSSKIKYHLVDGSYLTWFSPRITTSLVYLYKLIYGSSEN